MENQAGNSGRIVGKIVTWNTGRGYSGEGQLMSAVMVPSTGQIVFVDTTRGLEGVTQMAMQQLSYSDEDLREFVMAAYDAGRYDDGFYGVPDLGGGLDVSGFTVKLRSAAREQTKGETAFFHGIQETLKSGVLSDIEAPFMLNGGVFDAYSDVATKPDWVGVARNGLGFMLLGQENGERTYNQLLATEYKEALIEADGRTYELDNYPMDKAFSCDNSIEDSNGLFGTNNQNTESKGVFALYHPASNSMRVPKLLPEADRTVIPVVVANNELLHLRPPINGIHSAAMVENQPKANIAWLRALGHIVNVLNEGDHPQVNVGKRAGSWHITDKKLEKDGHNVPDIQERNNYSYSEAQVITADTTAQTKALSNEISMDKAVRIANEKGAVYFVDKTVGGRYAGKVMGVTAGHLVVNLGRAALVVSQDQIDVIPNKGDDVNISFENGRGMLTVDKVVEKGGQGR